MKRGISSRRRKSLLPACSSQHQVHEVGLILGCTPLIERCEPQEHLAALWKELGAVTQEDALGRARLARVQLKIQLKGR